MGGSGSGELGKGMGEGEREVVMGQWWQMTAADGQQ